LTRFILNEKEISTGLPAGMTLLDFIRYHRQLTGTKIGCREGDCGACTVLVGELKAGDLRYSSITSCLSPLANAHGKHIVTIEGINLDNELNPVQQAMADEGATQCGFCTPGFVMSFAGFCLSGSAPTKENAIAAVDGNICRCTGYKSIKRAAKKIALMMEDCTERPAQYVSDKKILPSYFSAIAKRLYDLNTKTEGEFYKNGSGQVFTGGGTDLYVQKHEEMKDAPARFVSSDPGLKGITTESGRCILGASTTVTEMLESDIIKNIFPHFPEYARLVSSTPIRNMATLAGNFVNASPIGDFTIFFLAMDAQIVLNNGKEKRELPLRKFYKGYKQLDKTTDELIEQIWFEIPKKNFFFNFEKLSKRTNLDIASVNTAINLRLNGDLIELAGISTGGVGPVPLFLEKTSSFMNGKKIDARLIDDIIKIAQTEISPISDARGTEEYKRLALSQLIKAHFLQMRENISS
jgi:xanthine dehydrogenase small subunit